MSEKLAQCNHQQSESENEDDLKAEFEEYYRSRQLTEDVTCGAWIFRGKTLQRLANKKVLVILFGITSCFFSSTFSYFSGTITTMEKRFKIPSKITGIVMVGNDITKLASSVVLNYYASRGHRPKWIAIGLYLIAIFCFMNALPHFLYGSGSDALQLTLEYGSDFDIGPVDLNITKPNKNLCSHKDNDECAIEEGSLAPPVILFISQLIGGVGTSIYHSLTYSYMDDNIKKTKSPALLSFMHFVRMFGPALGYGVVSICLKFYINPLLTPTITNSDPRWMGAWWLGWIILGSVILFCGNAVALLPKRLPRAAARREFMKQKKLLIEQEEVAPSVKDMWETIKRLLQNKVYLYSTLSMIFCIFGYSPFWTYLPKYIEIQYNKSASVASLVTGSAGLIFVGIGILLGGLGVQKIKPSGRLAVIWNTIIDGIFLVGVISYAFMGCNGVDNQINAFQTSSFDDAISNTTCNANCQCDYVKFSPVCSVETSQTYISACHAGCTEQSHFDNGTTIYNNCSCIVASQNSSLAFGSAVSGICETDCQTSFITFIVVKCLIKMFGAMSRVTGFLVIIRSVREQDKSISIGLQISAYALFALIPSPIFFGYIIDSACLIWGKTCTRKGNCWFFDTALMRNKMIFYSALFIFIGLIFDFFIVKNSKDLVMFDEIKKSDKSKKKRDRELQLNNK